jgi:hypothetical protein
MDNFYVEKQKHGVFQIAGLQPSLFGEGKVSSQGKQLFEMHPKNITQYNICARCTKVKTELLCYLLSYMLHKAMMPCVLSFSDKIIKSK